jgi:hypothetical protein
VVGSVLLPAGAASSEFHKESWYDARHGWKAEGSRVLSTEDGGRTWHRIFPRPVASVTRTSRTAGVIGIPRRRLWTTDNGRHWHPTTLIGEQFDGKNQWLFSIGGRTSNKLYQITPWPPRHRKVKRRLIATVERREFFGIESIPGGAAVAIDLRPGFRVPEVIIWQRGAKRRLVLPTPPRWPLGVCALSGFSVNWPAITVVGKPRETEFSCITDFAVSVIWWSPDAGDTWYIGG